MSLNERELSILTTIIEHFIDSAQPVGSRTVSKRSGLGLSPASMRNVMADLTDKGYLEQPHTSAGRVPTARAFRYYLDQVIRFAPLPEEERKTIRSSLAETAGEMDDLLRHAGKLLSRLSHQVSMVLPPVHADVRWKHIDFVLFKPTMVMVTLVLQGGMVHNKLVELENPVTPDDLTRFANYLNDQFEEKTVTEVRSLVLRELREAKHRLSRSIRQALHLTNEALAKPQKRDLYLEGTVNILSQPEFAQAEDIRDLLDILDEKTQILDLLDRVLESGGVLVSLDEAQPPTPLSDLSLIASPFSVEGQRLGAVGLIGPIRMNYAELMPVVRSTADIITSILQQRF
ncbi:heat-inducible transcriptional repressor HrcA [Desulfohalovibrio reitneri]|uniref:heat-inducible transcriptional repressor HrcA n=1 Tax=Desulfohalovibrio reitneri TaxID=1307759 RepID=UPI0004A70EC9|nr:heat-inducible transcriptional repressor HrcA [Desulfohalovibrio reitneri]